jgi:rare lipoprotein A (peptidoglycan hydrolase)
MKSFVLTIALALGLAAAPAAASVNPNAETGGGATARSRPHHGGHHVDRKSRSAASGQTGAASYYWQPQRLASGGRFNPNAMTAAHKTLPFGTRVRVKHLSNGRSVDVVINDRGPYVAGRIIDLSKAAAGQIGMTGQGVARVSMTVIGR